MEPFLPLTLLPTVKEKNICKTLSQLLKTYQHPPPAGNKVYLVTKNIFFSKYTRTTSVKIDVLLDFYNALCCVLELTEMSMKLMDNILAENDQYIYLFLNSVS